MKNDELDSLLLATAARKEISWGKITIMLRRQFELWANHKLVTHGYDGFKMAYMPVLMNIGPEGITNKELAKKAIVTKQAMNKVVKELERMGYVSSDVHCDDKRCIQLTLTTKGKEFALECRQRVFKLEEEYESLLGKKRFLELKKTLLEIMAYNQEKLAQQ